MTGTVTPLKRDCKISSFLSLGHHVSPTAAVTDM